MIVHETATHQVTENPENSFKFKGNQVQFELNIEILEDINFAIRYVETGSQSKAVSVLKESVSRLKKRNKLIRIADKSEGWWKTVDGYLSDEVVSDSKDEKRIRAADSRAVRKIKSSKKETKTPRKRPVEEAGAPSQSATNDGNFSYSMQPFRAAGAAVSAQQNLKVFSSAQHSDTGPVTAGKSSTAKKSKLPDDLLFIDTKKDFFKVQSIDNLNLFIYINLAKPIFMLKKD